MIPLTPLSIRTYQERCLRAVWGVQHIRVAYDDEPATGATWDSNANVISHEEGIDPLDAHVMLMRFAPHMYGEPKG